TAQHSAGMRTVILQCARGEHTRLLDLTRHHHDAYARSHGMQYTCRYAYHPADRSPGWDKIALILEALRTGGHDLIVWLDSDTLIADLSRSLKEALPPDRWLGLTR